MAGEENLEKTQKAYAAFSDGDSDGAMEVLADDIEWIVPGNSAVGGTKNGKEEVGEYWGQLADKDFSVSPEYWFADEERVVVLTRISLDGTKADGVDVATFRDGKVVKFQSALDTALLEKVYGSKDDDDEDEDEDDE